MGMTYTLAKTVVSGIAATSAVKVSKDLIKRFIDEDNKSLMEKITINVGLAAITSAIGFAVGSAVDKTFDDCRDAVGSLVDAVRGELSDEARRKVYALFGLGYHPRDIADATDIPLDILEKEYQKWDSNSTIEEDR